MYGAVGSGKVRSPKNTNIPTPLGKYSFLYAKKKGRVSRIRPHVIRWLYGVTQKCGEKANVKMERETDVCLSQTFLEARTLLFNDFALLGAYVYDKSKVWRLFSLPFDDLRGNGDGDDGLEREYGFGKDG